MSENFIGLAITMSFKLLLTDVISPLGKALEHELEREPFNLLMPTAAELDWSDPAKLAEYCEKHQPDLVINCRGWEEAYHKGGQALLLSSAALLAEQCGQRNI